MYDTHVAVIGTGFIGPVHVEALRRLGVHVVGVLGSSPEKSHLTAQKLGLAKGYNSFEQPNELWIGHRNQANASLMRDPSLLTNTARTYTDYPGGHNQGFPDTFKQCFRAFYDYIKADDFSAPATFPTFADCHREILLCEAILKSHLEGRWVEFVR